MRAQVQVVSLLAGLLASQIVWANDLATASPGIRIGDGYQLTDRDIAGYAMIEKSEERWTVKAVDKKLPSLTNPATQEILAFSRDLSVVEPAFSEYRNQWKAAKAPDFVCRSGDKGTRPVYNPCESSLTAEHAPVIAALVNMVSLGGATIGNNGLRSLRRVQPDAVRVAVERSGALEAIQSAFPSLPKRAGPPVAKATNGSGAGTQQWELDNAISSADLQRFIDRYAENDPGGLVPEAKLRKYRKDYFTAITSEEIETFIRLYADNDPEGYVAKAKQQLPLAKERERAAALDEYRDNYNRATNSDALRIFIRRYADADPDTLVPKARKRLAEVEKEEAAASKRRDEESRREAKRRDEAERKKRLQLATQERELRARLDSWRKALKVGDDTNCGPVLENRGAMIKVYLPSGGPSNEHWAKRDQIYPAGGEPCGIRAGSVASGSRGTVRDRRIGLKVCKEFMGNTFQTVQYAGRNIPINEKLSLITVTGYVEDAANGQLQIRIGAIRAFLRDPTPHEIELEEVNNQPGVRKGGIVWDGADTWKGC